MRASRILAAAALLALLAGACGGDSNAQPPGACTPKGILGEGDRIPAGCSFDELDGAGTFRLESLEGKPAVINFWASWCVFCLKEMPAFERVHRDLGERVTIVGADLAGIEGETVALARTYASARGVTYHLIVDEDGLLYSHFVLTRVTDRPILPTTIFVDAEGRIVSRHFGPIEEDQLRELLRTELGLS